MVQVLTYNMLDESLFPYKNGLQIIEGEEVFIAQGIFTKKGRKSPEFVTPDNPLWKETLVCKSRVKKVVAFLGKKRSGGYAMGDILIEEYKDRLDCLFFVVCRHVSKEYITSLKKQGVAEENISIFKDCHAQCKESPLLEGYMLYFLRFFRED